MNRVEYEYTRRIHESHYPSSKFLIQGRILLPILRMRNQTLIPYPPGPLTVFNLTTEGSNWLWSVFALMAFSSMVIALLSMRLEQKERTYHLFNIAILSTASIAYFCMVSGLGTALVEVYRRGPAAREFWYVRYIDCVVTTPLLLTELLLIAGLPLNVILSSIFADEVMIVCGLVGGLVMPEYKWAFYVFGCLAMFWVSWNLILGIKASEEIGGSKHRRTYLILVSWILVLWSIYPIAWGLCKGANVISVTGEMIFYGILDVLSKPGFAALSLFLHRKIDHAGKRSPPTIPIQRTEPTGLGTPPYERAYAYTSAHYSTCSPDVIREQY